MKKVLCLISILLFSFGCSSNNNSDNNTTTVGDSIIILMDILLLQLGTGQVQEKH